jgi:hypothetical protein
MDLALHSTYKEAEMQNLQNIQRDSLPAPLDAIGGEPLAGSGFETERPESDFHTIDGVDE